MPVPVTALSFSSLHFSATATFSTGRQNLFYSNLFNSCLSSPICRNLFNVQIVAVTSSAGAKVVIDSNSGPSKGYGFRFGDENERTRAMTEMNEIYCSSRPMHIGVATPSLLGGVSKKIEYLEIIISYGLHE